MIVDDNLLIRRLLGEIVTSGGHEVVGEAADGTEAPRLLRETRPEVVMLDLVMPGRGGLVTLPHLLMIDPRVTVIVCSASLNESRVLQAIRLGARGFIIKPLERAKVLDALHGTLSEAHGRQKRVAMTMPDTLMDLPEDQREFERIRVRLPAVLELSGTERIHTVTADVSGGGMLLEAGEVGLGDRVDFRLHLGVRPAPVDGRARVARVDPEGRPALAFEHLRVDDYERLIRFLYAADGVEPPGVAAVMGQ